MNSEFYVCRVFFYVLYRCLTDIKLYLKCNLLYTDKDVRVKMYIIVLYSSQFNRLILWNQILLYPKHWIIRNTQLLLTWLDYLQTHAEI